MTTTSTSASRGLARRTVLGGALMGVAAAGSGVATASPAHAAPSGRTRRVTLYAEQLPGGLYGYGLTPGGASVPGPVLELWEGESLEIDLVNATDRPVSLHPHGVGYTVDSDGSPMNDSVTRPGETRTYLWSALTPSPAKDGTWLPGSAGYWHYHDHALGTDHGTEGVRKGLYGALVVRRKGDPLPDRQFTVVFNDMSINNLRAPHAPVLEARLGERVEFIAVGHGGMLHTFHLHSHRWANNRTGLLSGPNDPSQVIDTRNLNPGESFGFQVVAGAGVGPGAWMYHCHVQSHSDGGMAGVFLVRNADGSMPDGAQDALDRYGAHPH